MRKIILVGGIIAVVLIAIGGGWYWQTKQTEEDKSTAEEQRVAQEEQQRLLRLKTTCIEMNAEASCIRHDFDVVTGTCISKPIVPCCGNSMCETDERNSCAEDCRSMILQDESDTNFPVKYLTYSDDFQMAAQTFTPPEDDLDLIAISPYFGYVLGDKAYVELYRITDPKAPKSGELLKFIELDVLNLPRGDYYTINLDSPVPLSREETYSFLVYVEEIGSEVGIGKISYKDVYPEGRAWYFTRLIGGSGELLDATHDWRSYNDDLRFQLTFLKQEVDTTQIVSEIIE